RRPEERAIQALAANGPNQPFYEGMRAWRIGHGRDCFDVEDAQVRLPSVELEQPIMIGTQVLRRCLVSYRAVEHPAQAYPILRAGAHAKADDSTGVVV